MTEAAETILPFALEEVPLELEPVAVPVDEESVVAAVLPAVVGLKPITPADESTDEREELVGDIVLDPPVDGPEIPEDKIVVVAVTGYEAALAVVAGETDDVEVSDASVSVADSEERVETTEVLPALSVVAITDTITVEPDDDEGKTPVPALSCRRCA
ncbi:hypothetical protein M8818_003720 [Zalaria obscura]|uniref:Uncharacterized protein n=1 Tax=Zalaria obscura TaxID=2024903 RepID=A0ACC3SH61_9PEZI